MKTHVRRGMLLVAGAALALAVSIVAPVTTMSSANADTSDVLTDVQTLVDNLGTTVYSTIYGGYTAPNNGAEIDVYLTDLDPVAEAAFDLLSPVPNIVFKSTQNTIATLDSWTDQLESSWDSIDAQGIDLNEFGPDVETGQLDIGVVGLTDADTAYFDGLFGAANVNVYNLDQADVDAVHDLVTRTADTAPYNGGDAIMNKAETSGCSSGFGIRVGVSDRMLTAGHCWAVGSNVINKKISGSTLVGSGAAMGSVTQDPYKNGGTLDAEVFTGWVATRTVAAHHRQPRPQP